MPDATHTTNSIQGRGFHSFKPGMSILVCRASWNTWYRLWTSSVQTTADINLGSWMFWYNLKQELEGHLKEKCELVRPNWRWKFKCAILAIDLSLIHVTTWDTISCQGNVFSKICGLLTAFLRAKQFYLLTSMSEADTESQSHKKLLMSVSRAM